MLFLRKSLNLYTKLCLVVVLLKLFQWYGGGNAHHVAQPTYVTKTHLVDKVMKLLTKLEQSNEYNINVKFAVLLSGFLIKQKVRFYESIRYEEQLFYNIFQKLFQITQNMNNGCNSTLSQDQQIILKNIFQKNVLLLPPSLKWDRLTRHLDYKALMENYDQLSKVGRPNETESDHCLAGITTLDAKSCQLLDSFCLLTIFNDLPNYGYQRTHQVLILYVFTHHLCSRSLETPFTYAKLAHEKCSQVYREQKALQHLGLPNIYRDLYLEQMVVCGLFGYVEFLNWPNMASVMHWPQEDDCLCLFVDGERLIDCNCTNHINSLLLVHYINGLLMLNFE